MNRIVGEIDTYPWLTVTVETRTGKQDIRFLVDTGFSGEIAIPRSYTPMFGTSQYSIGVEFADGVEEDTVTVECQIHWIGGWRTVEAMYIDGKHPLLGMELLDNCTVTLETENGRGDIVVEGIE